jgi:4-amino-4-deoxy-L-arabinose transferase-like glycosyltransferase
VIPWWGWIVLLVLAEATLWLVFLPTSQVQTFGGDGAEYQRLASNLLHHGVFSEALTGPYYPSVVRSPGYPAFLALIEWLGASHTVAIQAAQFGVVASLAVVVGLIGRETAGHTVGTLSAVLCATYLPFLGFATRFLTEDLGSFCLAVMILLLLIALRSDRALAYAGAGLALAALAYIRPEFILLAVPVAVILVARRTGSPWRSVDRWSRGLAFAGLFIAVLVPWTIRNAALTNGRLLPMAATSGSDLLASAEQYDGFITYKLTIADWHRYLTHAAEIAPTPVQDLNATGQVRVDDRLRSAAVRTFESLSVGQVIRSLPKRIAYLWGTADAPPLGRSTNVAHRLAQLQYAALVLLGLIGVVIRRRRLLRDWPLWITAAYLSTVHLVFHVEGRYTLPARPPLMIYSAVAAVALASFLHRRFRTDRSSDAIPVGSADVVGTVSNARPSGE